MLRESSTTAQDRLMTTLVFLGAGSVVFTRQLIADLLRYSDLSPFTLRLFEPKTGLCRIRSRTSGTGSGFL